MTPYQIAKKKQRENKKQEFCISQEVCPECGKDLSVEYKTRMGRIIITVTRIAICKKCKFNDTNIEHI